MASLPSGSASAGTSVTTRPGRPGTPRWSVLPCRRADRTGGRYGGERVRQRLNSCIARRLGTDLPEAPLVALDAADHVRVVHKAGLPHQRAVFGRAALKRWQYSGHESVGSPCQPSRVRHCRRVQPNTQTSTPARLSRLATASRPVGDGDRRSSLLLSAMVQALCACAMLSDLASRLTRGTRGDAAARGRRRVTW